MPEKTLFPITTEQQNLVIQATYAWIEKASEIYDRHIQAIDVVFDLKGRTSGMFCTRSTSVKDRQLWIRYNPWIFAKYFEDSLATTVPHEVAHYVCFLLYGRKHKPHGKEWKAIMNQFGVPAKATCSLDISDLPQKG